jgi:hypothetical protein
LAIRRAKLGPDHVSTLQLESNLAGVRRTAGRGAEAEPIAASVVVRAAGRPADAERELLRAHEEATAVNPPDTGLVDDIRAELVKLYEEQGNDAEARRWRTE